MHLLDRARNIAGRRHRLRAGQKRRGNAARLLCKGRRETTMPPRRPAGRLGEMHETWLFHYAGASPGKALRRDAQGGSGSFILAERLGYSEGYCGEHLTDAAENIPNSMMFIATLLGATSQMKVGTAVVNLPHSHPVVVASNAAMLDNLFEGRF